MKKIMIIDGGPRKNFNTAAMCEKVAEGVRSVGGNGDSSIDTKSHIVFSY